ncbi:MAG: AAA family ATPase [Planctomycetes bacterium]|nr:AAA family ATPase [Planctomycetota bacterium]
MSNIRNTNSKSAQKTRSKRFACDLAKIKQLTAKDGPLHELRGECRWVDWKFVRRKGKLNKLPFNPKTGELASTIDPKTWSTLGVAVRAYRLGKYSGLGFVLGGIYVGVDLDNCVDLKKHFISDEAMKIIRMLGTYWEISPSGRGVKLIGKCTSLPKGKGIKRPCCELYHASRYFTVTGHCLDEISVSDITSNYLQLYKKLKRDSIEALDTTLLKQSPTNLTDKQIIKEIRVRHLDLWNGEWQKAGYPSRSEADLALCYQLVLRCGSDLDRINLLFRKSKLMRKKWERKDYRELTIMRALSGCYGMTLNEKSSGRLVTTLMSDVKPKPVEWLWDQRFPSSKLSLIAGAPGVGKSYVTTYMAACISTGRAWHTEPDRPQPKGSVIMLSAEDDPEDSLRPRLDEFGADPSKILHVSGTIDKAIRNQETRMVCLIEDMSKLKHLLRSYPDCRLVVIDPINAYLSGIGDSYKDTEIRKVLNPLQVLACECEVAIIVVTHLSKGGRNSSQDPLQRVIGSIGYVGTARAVWGVMKDPEDPQRRLMLPLKSNYGPDFGTGMAYRFTPGHKDLVWRIEWDDEAVQIEATDVFEKQIDKDKHHLIDEACDFIKVQLNTGTRWAKDMKKWAIDAGHASRTIDRAKRTLRIVSEKSGFGNKQKWYWRLPEQEAKPPIDKKKKT